MAKFDVEAAEGMRWVKVTLENETVRTEKGILNHFIGDISMDVPLPRPRDFVVSMVSQESPLRPRFQGTGELFLESSLGGFHIMQITDDERWILGNGAYWASESDVKLTIFRERIMTSFWAGEGFFWYLTAVRGSGKIVLACQGPVDEMKLQNGRMVVDGNYVVARTSGIKLSIRRPERSYISHLLSGENYARVYEGTGRLLMCTTPYWRFRFKGGELKDPIVAD